VNKIHLLRANKPGTATRCELVQGDGEDTLYVYGVIGADFWGDGVPASDFVKAVRQSTAGRLNVRINSPGGDVFEGVAMAQALRDFKGETVAYVDGMAASAATFLTTAAGKTLMAKGSMLMVHQAWTVAIGNSTDLTTMASLLDKIDNQIAEQYAAKSGVTVDQAKAWMAAETWFSDTEAVAAGLADGLQGDDGEEQGAGDGSAENRAKQWNLEGLPFARVPKQLSAVAAAPAPAPAPAPAAAPAPPPAAPANHDHERASRLLRLLGSTPA